MISSVLDQICLLFSFQGMNRTYQICTSGHFICYDLPGVLHAISIQECPHGIVPDCSSHAKHGFIDWNSSPSGRVVSIKNVWQPPALPCRLQHSTIGRTDLHRRVRDGNGCALRTHRHQTDFSRILSFPSLHENPTEM